MIIVCIDNRYFIKHLDSGRYYYRCYVRQAKAQQELVTVEATFDNEALRTNFLQDRNGCTVS